MEEGCKAKSCSPCGATADSRILKTRGGGGHGGLVWMVHRVQTGLVSPFSIGHFPEGLDKVPQSSLDNFFLRCLV